MKLPEFYFKAIDSLLVVPLHCFKFCLVASFVLLALHMFLVEILDLTFLDIVACPQSRKLLIASFKDSLPFSFGIDLIDLYLFCFLFVNLDVQVRFLLLEANTRIP